MKKLSFTLFVFVLSIACIAPIIEAEENATTIPENITTTTTIQNVTTTTTTLETTTTIPLSNKTENITTTTIPLNETTTTSTTVPATTSTTLETTTTTTTSTLPPKPEDKEPPVWANLRHEPSVVRESDPVDVIVGWYDNVGLDTVIIYENSTGSWEEHVCDKNTGHCSPGVIHSSMVSDLSSFLAIMFITPFTVVIIKLMRMGRIPRIVLPFIGLVISILLLSILLFPEVPRSISRALSRLGIMPWGRLKTFSHTVPASNLDVGEVVAYYSFANDSAGNEDMTEIKSFTVQAVEVVSEEKEEEIETSSIKEEHEEAEIGKPVKWRKELVVTNPSLVEVKGYEVTGLPRDARNIIVKDEEGRILYRDEVSWETDIAEKEEISYFVEYETPAPYKEESVMKPFVSGKTYKKRINVKSDFVGHYQDVKAYTDIPEEAFQENYIIKLYLIVGDLKIDVTDDPIYEVKFVDSDNDGLNDRIEWVVPQLSEEEFEVKASITIINVQSYPTVWGNWTVRFDTTGTANLTITPIDNTNFDVDIKFLELKCGDNVVDPLYDGRSVFYSNWSCSEEGRIINQVLKPGKHTLEFRYGDDVEYAYNQAGGRFTISFEDFESGFTYWDNTVGDDNDCWQTGSSTPSSGTGPQSGGAEGTSNFAFYEASTSCAPNGQTAFLLGPTIDFDGNNSVNITYWYHQYGTALGTLSLEIEDGAGGWTELWSRSGPSEDTWYKNTIDLSAYDDTGKKALRFKQTGHTGWSADSSVDEINITGTLANVPPTTPTNIRCNGNDNCDIDVDAGVTLQASGSTDDDGDTITYYIEALLNSIFTSDDQEPGEQEHKAETTTGITTYNFATCIHGTNCWAYENDVDQFPFGGNTANRNDHAEPTTAEYTYISAVNGQWMTDDPGTRDEMLLWLEFYINLGESPIEDITEIDFTFFGNTDGSAATDYTIWVLKDGEAWQTDASWTQLGGSTSVPQDVDTWVNRSLDSNFATYINSGTGLITWAVFSNTASEDMRVNYVEMKVSYGTTKDDDYNETFIEYTAIDGPDLGSITSIEVITQVSYYDPRGSVNTGNTRPDLEIGVWDGSVYDTGHLCNLVSYYGDSESSVKYNCTISITDPIVMTAWETASNRKIEIRGDFLDTESGFDDTVRWDSVWVIINGKELIEIGSHLEGLSFYWDTSSLPEQDCIDLRTRAIDLTGSNTYSDYYTKGSCLNVVHGVALPFEIKLPGIDPIVSSGIAPGTLSTPIEFNASDSTDYDVQPCVYGYGCAPGFTQDTNTPIFNFTNTGSIAEKWNISLSESLPSYITLYGNTSLDSTLQEINTNGWIANNNVPPQGFVKVWLWANFINAQAGTVSNIFINHTSIQA